MYFIKRFSGPNFAEATMSMGIMEQLRATID